MQLHIVHFHIQMNLLQGLHCPLKYYMYCLCMYHFHFGRIIIQTHMILYVPTIPVDIQKNWNKTEKRKRESRRGKGN